MAEVQRRIVLLSGLSGAGKTTATKSLEDVGFRTIDNVPHELLPALVEKIAEGKLKTWFAENILTEQPFVKDESMTVAQLLAKAGLKPQ